MLVSMRFKFCSYILVAINLIYSLRKFAQENKFIASLKLIALAVNNDFEE